MTDTTHAHVDELAAQDARLVLPAFDATVAWQLGCAMQKWAHREGLSAVIEMRRPAQVLFRAALPGTTAENEAWLERKAATVLRVESSTALVGARFAAQGVDPEAAGWFDTVRHTTAAGAVPVGVAGEGLVGAVTLSGLTSERNHAFAVEALDALRAEAGS